MEKRLKNYLNYLSKITNPEKDLKDKLLIQISFFQHERLIHFLVTMLFSVLTVICFICLMNKISMALLLLVIILFIVLLFYIRHYYILENGVQKLYQEYDRLFDQR